MTTIKTHTVTIKQPIKIDDKDVTEFQFREPLAADLYGVNVLELLSGDPAQGVKVVPVLSDPMVSEQQFAALPARQALALMGGVSHFFADEALTEPGTPSPSQNPLKAPGS